MLKLIATLSAMAALVMVLGVTEASAGAITVNGFSFEGPDEGASGASDRSVTSWTASGSGTSTSFGYGVYAPVNPTQYQKGSDGLGPLPGLIVPDGKQAAYESAIVTLFQATSATIADNTTYTLSVYVGHRADNGILLPANISFALTANGVAIGGTGTQSIITSTVAAGQWVQETLTYTTTTAAGDPFLGQTLGIDLIDGSSTGQVNWDDVVLSSAANGPLKTPEPLTISLFGAGLAGAAVFRHRRKKAIAA